MDLVWSNDLASASFLETLRTCPNLTKMGVPELLSGVAAGWKSKLIVEQWSPGDSIEESVGLTIAARHTGGRHVFIVRNELHKENYLRILQEMGITLMPEMVVADAAETVMPQFENVDFLIVDCNNINLGMVLRAAKLRPQGAVLARKNVNVHSITLTQFQLRVQQEARVVVERTAPGLLLDIMYTRSMAHPAPPPPQPPLQPQPQQQQPQPQPQPPQPDSPRRRTKIWFRVIDPRDKAEHDFQI